MVATSDFSGLVNSACALAKAAAIAPMESLERCMGALHAEDIKAQGAGSRAFGPDSVADRLLGVLWNKPLEFCLGVLMLEESLSRPPKYAREFRPGIG